MRVSKLVDPTPRQQPLAELLAPRPEERLARCGKAGAGRLSGGVGVGGRTRRHLRERAHLDVVTDVVSDVVSDVVTDVVTDVATDVVTDVVTDPPRARALLAARKRARPRPHPRPLWLRPLQR